MVDLVEGLHGGMFVAAAGGGSHNSMKTIRSPLGKTDRENK
jgi:hypothetical protein